MAFFGTLTMALIMVVLVLPPFAYSESFRKTFQIDSLWLDSFYKQISGFSIVALIGLTTFLSLSKRWNGFRFGRFVQWRNLHLIAGFICIVLLVAHTGMNRGVNLNGWLMFDFLLLSALGGFAAFTSSQASIFPAATAIKIRRSVNWLHLLAFWPFPVLLSFHILSSYYF